MPKYCGYIRITYPVENPDQAIIETTSKFELVYDVLSEFIHSQVGKGKDESKANELDVYTILIQLDLSDDSFATEHDCGNKGLRDGIIMDVIGRKNALIKELDIQGLIDARKKEKVQAPTPG